MHIIHKYYSTAEQLHIIRCRVLCVSVAWLWLCARGTRFTFTTCLQAAAFFPKPEASSSSLYREDLTQPSARCTAAAVAVAAIALPGRATAWHSAAAMCHCRRQSSQSPPPRGTVPLLTSACYVSLLAAYLLTCSGAALCHAVVRLAATAAAATRRLLASPSLLACLAHWHTTKI